LKRNGSEKVELKKMFMSKHLDKHGDGKKGGGRTGEEGRGLSPRPSIDIYNL
jgi:hypothetical protein